MIEQPFLLLSLSLVLHLAFSITLVEFENDKKILEIEYLLSNKCSFASIFSFNTVNAFLLMVYFAFNFCFVEAIDDNIFTFGNIY